MAEFAAEVIQSFRPPFPLLELDPNTAMEQQIPPFTDLNHFNNDGSSNLLHNFHSFNNNNPIPTNQGQGFFTPHQMLALTMPENYPDVVDAFHQQHQSYMNVVDGNGGPSSSSSVPFHQHHQFPESRKRKMAPAADHLHLISAESSSMNILSPQASESGNKRKNGSRRGGGKRVRSKEEAGEGCGGNEKLHKEVVHVRARRGQATDSHSLAERVRRGKINERLRCLQNIVPGCYKTMGMAVMLDEIINYVQSLQNQVEFLSMKLTAASTFYDFNAETEAVETLQRAKLREAKEEGRVMKEGYDGGFSCFHSTWSL
ncbi:unnamed protein product [Linum tenue]|uniref:BHLH domain-containing protein n=1 Tax=Linum tenue TaxID=586396 RepID=A0AAV0IW20_9ROSI|nr:unnamed protein product [Linum tenue]